MVDSIAGTALKGIKAGLESAAQDAQRVSDAFRPDSTEDPVQPLVDLKLDQFQVKANTKVLEVDEEMNKSILDILA